MKTITGVFPSMTEARDAARALRKLGIADEEIIIAKDHDNPNRFLPTQRNMSAAGASGWGWLFAGFMPVIIHQKTALASGLVGGAVGCGLGLILGAVSRAIPLTLIANVNPIVAVIPFAAFCGFGGALAAYVYALGVSHEAAAVCAEADREHAVVVAVHVSEPVENKALATMESLKAAKLRDEQNPYRATDWNGEPIDEHTYPSDSEYRSFHAHA